MPEIVKQNIVIPVGGLTQEKQTDGSLLGEDTVNFYPDGEGYLVNYPGKTQYFKKLYGQAHGSVPEEITPAPAGTVQASKSYAFPPIGEMSRIFFYRDSSNQQHIVFVLEDKLCVVEGNGYRVLRFFTGQRRDGLCYPKLFMHNGFLVIANLGDPMLLWDGYSDVVPLGVTEAPNMPSVSVSRAPWYTNYGEKRNSSKEIMMTSPWSDYDGEATLEGGFFSKYGYWGNQGIWPCGPINYEPGGHFHGFATPGETHNRENWNETKWRWRARYIDRYGNLGPLSAPTGIVTVPLNVDLMSQPALASGSLDSRTSLRDWDGKSFATVYWEPPKHDWHIAGVRLYKTLDLHQDKGNSPNVFYTEHTQRNTNCCRRTSVAGDSALSDAADDSVSGPPSTDLAASWGNRVVARDPENKEKMLYSDPGQMGEFRSSNVYKAKDAIEALLPLGDRLLIITRSTSEVLYYDNGGLIHHLETFEDKGSSYGPSFSVFGDQAFGLFNDGFFRFDGKKFAETNSPYYLEKGYIDRWHDIQNSVVQGEWYFLSIRKEMFSDENNYILMCHLPTSRWFQVKEEVRDMAVIGDYILGVKDTIYFLFRGDTYEDSTIHISGLLSSGVLIEKTLSSMSVMLEPASKNPMTVSVSGADSFDKVYGSATSYPSKSTVLKSVDYYPFYNDDKTSWGEGYDWVSPNDYHIRINMAKNVTDFKHDVTLGFSGPQRVKALSFEYSVGGQIADKK